MRGLSCALAICRRAPRADGEPKPQTGRRYPEPMMTSLLRLFLGALTASLALSPAASGGTYLAPMKDAGAVSAAYQRHLYAQVRHFRDPTGYHFACRHFEIETYSMVSCDERRAPIRMREDLTKDANGNLHLTRYFAGRSSQRTFPMVRNGRWLGRFGISRADW